MKRILTFFIPLALFTALLIGFWQLGAFNEPEIVTAVRPRQIVAGRFFDGALEKNAEKYQKVQQDVQQQWKSGTLEGTRCVYFYDNPDTSQTVKALIGLITGDSTRELPEGYRYVVVPRKKVVRAVLSTSRWIAPNPQEMYVQLARYAQQQGLTLNDRIFEKHHQSGTIITEIEVEE